ncbi:MAG: phosphosulfolactate phosphohydrolase [Microbacteriaceae bacterium]|nr:MAG: phosphosulfolactate phosphohydrolase [Microbacteriaceae bacterium]
MVAPRPVETLTQSRYEVRFDWAVEGLNSIAPDAGVIVVVDAISFTTTIELAVAHGLAVLPHSGQGSAADAAGAAGAALGKPRGEPGVSLSPSSITPESVAGIAPLTRVLMPSLNGSRVCASAAVFGVPVVAATLRNRTAVARWILSQQAERGTRLRVAIVAAGEVRADGTTRFCVEDLLTAGAVVDALATVGIDYCSPEAAAACAAYTGLARATGHLLTASVSGQQLIEDGQRADVELAAQLDVSDTVPVLRDGAFVGG